MNYNNLSIEIYKPYSTVIKLEAMAEIKGASINEMTSFFPGGLYGHCSFFIPKEIIRDTGAAGRDRVVIRNGQKIVWEGELSTITFVATKGAREGVLIDCVGPWGSLLQRETLDRRWADDRISPKAWKEDETSAAAEFAVIDRKDRLRITPKAEAWINGEGATLRYEMPEGETVGRISGTSQLSEAAQAWEMTVIEYTTPNTFHNRTADGTGAFDADHGGTAINHVLFQLITRANQTPTSEGTYFGEVVGPIAYAYKSSDTYGGDPTVDIIAKDIANEVSDINADINNIDTPASNLTLIPFYTEGREPMGNILLRATSFGDASSNELYAQLRDSEQASAPDGKPVLFVKQYPALTSYDHVLRMDEENIATDVKVSLDYSQIFNWISVEYDDVDEERTIIVNPNDQATLLNQDSIDEWGQRELPLKIGKADATMALNIGVTALAAAKNPSIYVKGPVGVQGYIRNIGSGITPSSQIKAGDRIRFENFLTDLVGIEAAGLTTIITSTSYNDATETTSMTFGVPDNLSVFLAQLDLKFS